MPSKASNKGFRRPPEIPAYLEHKKIKFSMGWPGY